MSQPASAPEVAVLGGGIAGLTIAWRLLRRGASVTVVAGEQPSASVMAAGMLAPMPELALNSSLGRLAADGLRAYPAFLDALAEDTDQRTGFQRSGLVRVAYGDDEATALRDEVGAYEAAGMPSRWLDARSCAADVPGLGTEGLSGGLLCFEESQVQPQWLIEALTDAIHRRGGEVTAGHVVDLDRRANATVVGVDVGGSREELVVDAAVVALGSWSGLVQGAELEVRPVKGQLLAFAGAAGPSRILYRGHHYLLTKADGTVLLGATMEEAGFSIDADGLAEQLRGELDVLWPALAAAPATARAGLRPASPDGLPIVGWLSEGVYAFTAHFRNGFLLSPLAATLAANEVVGDKADDDLLAPLRPQRFTRSGLGSRAT